MIILCFFFFKQKTAYEMRISDWSSDVCSSDLHLGGRRLLALCFLHRQQQPRLEIGEPGRHHEIVRRDLEPKAARLLDEDQILLRQREDRDLRQVDLLVARQRQQQVERPLEALQREDRKSTRLNSSH